jgi:hypothetical protein
VWRDLRRLQEWLANCALLPSLAQQQERLISWQPEDRVVRDLPEVMADPLPRVKSKCETSSPPSSP